MNKNLLMVSVLVVLVLVATVQAVQLVGIRGDMQELSSGTVVKKTTLPAQSAGSATSGSSVPTNLQNLPGMVGGC